MLSANNPFRDRTETSSAARPSSAAHTGQLKSRNPFLDPVASSSQPGSMSQPSRPAEARTARKPRPNEPVSLIDAQSSRGAAETRRTERRKDGPSASKSADKEDPTQPSSTTKSRSKPAGRRKHLDKIDMLDVTGFSSGGGGFHHDGPFDACNPARNKNTQRAPVLAFAKDSPSMSLSGGVPTQPVYFGDHVKNAESFADYGNNVVASPPKTRPDLAMRSTSFDPSQGVDPIHGQESIGLGATTFLEGTPASYNALMSRTISDTGHESQTTDMRPRATSEYAGASGLGRKKSVIQRIRGAYRERAMEGRAGDNPLASGPPSRSVQGSPITESQERGSVDVSSRTNPTDFKVVPRIQTPEVAGTMSPLYRPSSSGTAASSSNPNGLIRRVKSLRVGKKN